MSNIYFVDISFAIDFVQTI